VVLGCNCSDLVRLSIMASILRLLPNRAQPAPSFMPAPQPPCLFTSQPVALVGSPQAQKAWTRDSGRSGDQPRTMISCRNRSVALTITKAKAFGEYPIAQSLTF
jgi:hypothetical protein